MLAWTVFLFCVVVLTFRWIEHRKLHSKKAKARQLANLCDQDVEKLLLEGQYHAAIKAHQTIHNSNEVDAKKSISIMLTNIEKKHELLESLRIDLKKY